MKKEGSLYGGLCFSSFRVVLAFPAPPLGAAILFHLVRQESRCAAWSLQLRRRSHQGVQKSGREERGHPLPFDNNIGSRRASTRRYKAKRAAVLTASWGSSGTFDENMLEPGTEIKHSKT